MAKIRVAVLRGGPSSEYEVSLKTGANVLKALPEDKYIPHDIFISEDGTWHHEGVPVTPEQVFKKTDVVFNALHGEYGEDGTVQKILEAFNVPFTGSKSFPSAVGMNKVLSKKVYRAHGLRTPHSAIIIGAENLHRKLLELFRTFPMPAVVKPASAGSSVGVSVAKNFEELEAAVKKALEYGETVLVEECIAGREATCGVVDHFRGAKIYSLLPVEIIKPEKSAFFDYDAKYGGGSQEICPGNFSAQEKEQIQEMARRAHEALGLRHYSRSDFMIHPKRGIYILETNTLPGLTDGSLLPKSLVAVGASLPEFLDHLITLARTKK